MSTIRSQAAAGELSCRTEKCPPSLWSLGVILLLAVAVTGCRKEQISVYRIPKESDAPAAAAAPGGHEAMVAEQVKYQTPAGWTEHLASDTAPASFSIAGDKAQVTIMTFPKVGVSQLSLLNIIREKSNLPPLSDAEVAKLVEPVGIGEGIGQLIDLSSSTGENTNSTPTASVLVALVEHGGATWFFKLFGAPDVVAAQKPALRDFLKSISFVAAAGGGAMPPGHVPIASAGGGMSPSATASLPPPPAVDKPAWEIPAGWHEVSPGQMLLAKFSLAENGGAADVTVSSFGGDAGGPLANINRWRGQLSLPPVAAADFDKSYTSLDVSGGKAMLVDVTGTSKDGKPSRLIGLIWPRGGDTWFYKMMGDAAVTGGQKEAFLKFIQSVKYPNG